MPEYQYIAVDDSGNSKRGTMFVENEQYLESKLKEMGYILVKAEEIKTTGFSLFERINRKDLIQFTVHLSTILDAGIPLLVGLRDIASQTQKRKMRYIIDDIANRIEAGASLSEAMSEHSNVFSELYVNMIYAGEKTGNLEEVLNDLIDFLSWQDELAANVKQAMIYPAVILVAGMLLILFLLSFVLPRFLIVFKKAKVQLPLPTRVLLTLSSFFEKYWIFVILFLISLIVIVKLLLKTEKGRYFFDSIKLKLPIFGSLIKKVALSRFAHYMASLLKSGVDIVESLWVAERVIGNAVLARVIRESIMRVKDGEPLSACLSESGHFPPLIVRMIQIGESTGTIDTTLTKVSEHYDKEVPYTIKKIFAIFEPLMIILLGAVVVSIALSMFLPMYQMIRIMSKG